MYLDSILVTMEASHRRLRHTARPATVAEGRWRSGKPEWGRKADPCRPRIRRTPPVNPASGLEVGGSGGHGLYRNSFFDKLHVSLRLFPCSSVFR